MLRDAPERYSLSESLGQWILKGEFGEVVVADQVDLVVMISQKSAQLMEADPPLEVIVRTLGGDL